MVFCTKASGWRGHLYEVEERRKVRMREQTNREHHNGGGGFKLDGAKIRAKGQGESLDKD